LNLQNRKGASLGSFPPLNRYLLQMTPIGVQHGFLQKYEFHQTPSPPKKALETTNAI